MGVMLTREFEFSLFLIGFLLLFSTPFLFYLRGRVGFSFLLSFVFFLLAVMAGRGAYESKDSGLNALTLASENVRVIGWVTSEPEMKRYGKKETLSFVLTTQSLLQFQNNTKQEFKTQERMQVFLHQPGEVPRLGDQVRIWGKLESPKPVLNPGQFDYGAYLENQNISFVFRAYGKSALRILEKGNLSFTRAFVLKVRSWIDLTLKEQYDEEAEILFRALVIGKRKNISPELRDLFMKTGTAHLLAISGLHMGLFAGALFFLLLLLRLDQKQAAVASLLLVTAYIFIAGAGIPVQRAGVMSLIVLSAVLLERKSSPLNTFCFVFCLLLLAEPKIIFSIAFQLSFISVLSLILWTRDFEEAWFPGDIFFRSLVVLAGTFPLVLYHFNVISWVGILTNTLAIPLFHLALLNVFAGLIFSKLVWVSAFFQSFAESFLWAGLQWIKLCAFPDWGYFFVKSPTKKLILLYYFVLFLCWLTRKLPKLRNGFMKPLSLGLLLSVSFCFFRAPKQNKFEVTQLSSGKNEIYHLNFFDKSHWFINSGRGAPSSQVKWVLEPYLKSKGINRVEGLLLLDDYAKHRGGLKALKENFSLRTLYYPQNAKKLEGLPRSFFPSKKSPLKTGEFEHRGQTFFRVLGEVEKGVLVLIEQEGAGYLFLPKLSEDVLKVMEENKNELLRVDALLLTSDSVLTEKTMQRLFDLLDPEVVVKAGDQDSFEEFLWQRDILYLNPMKQGAVSLTGMPKVLRQTQHVSVQTFLGSLGIKA